MLALDVEQRPIQELVSQFDQASRQVRVRFSAKKPFNLNLRRTPSMAYTSAHAPVPTCRDRIHILDLTRALDHILVQNLDIRIIDQVGVATTGVIHLLAGIIDPNRHLVRRMKILKNEKRAKRDLSQESLRDGHAFAKRY